MTRRIRIKAGSINAVAELNDTVTADEVWNILPIDSKANTWGDEVYFAIPLHIDLEDGKEVVNAGDLGYWPTGSAFCIFFGLTPASRGDEIRPASAVNVFGRLTGHPGEFKAVGSGERVTVERA